MTSGFFLGGGGITRIDPRSFLPFSSDLSVKLKDGSTRFGHMFVFSARSSLWEKLGEDVREMGAKTEQGKRPSQSFKTASSVADWSHLDQPVAETVLLWIYTDELPSSSPPRFVLSVMRAAHELGLSELVSRCQETLVCAVDAESCVEFYAAADEIGADALREHCSKLISAHWVGGHLRKKKIFGEMAQRRFLLIPPKIK